MGTRKLSVDRPICQQCGNVIEEGRSRSKPPTDAKYCLSCRAERRRRANLKHVWRPEYGVYLKTHYYGGLNRRFQVVNRMICETGLPRWYIKKRASRLGLTMHQNRRPWTAAEEAIVERLLGNVSALTIAKRLKRSETSVVLKIKRMGLSRRVRNGYTMRDLVRDGSVMLFTKKTGGHILLPIPKEVQKTLECLPLPDSAKYDTGYFFWGGKSDPQTLVTDVSRALKSVFDKSGVKNAHSHRFRHTLATEILGKGGTMGQVADILGISESVARKHYAKWSLERQEQVWKIMAEIQRGPSPKPTSKPEKTGTSMVRGNTARVN